MLLNINIIVSIITTILVNTEKTCHGFVNLKSSKLSYLLLKRLSKQQLKTSCVHNFQLTTSSRVSLFKRITWAIEVSRHSQTKGLLWSLRLWMFHLLWYGMNTNVSEAWHLVSFMCIKGNDIKIHQFYVNIKAQPSYILKSSLLISLKHISMWMSILLH